MSPVREELEDEPNADLVLKQRLQLATLDGKDELDVGVAGVDCPRSRQRRWLQGGPQVGDVDGLNLFGTCDFVWQRSSLWKA